MISILTVTLAITITLFLVGFGFTAIFIPEKLRKDAFWFTPWIGTMLIGILSVIFSLGRIPVKISGPAILFGAVLLLIYSLWKRKFLPLRFPESLIFTILILFSLLFNLFTLATKVGFPTTISYGNLDPVAYSTVGVFLYDHSVDEGAELGQFMPAAWPIGDLVHFSFRWGSPMILSFFQSIFHWKPHQIFYILIVSYFALIIPLIAVFSRRLYEKKEIFPESPKIRTLSIRTILKPNILLTLLVGILFSFNSNLLYMLYNNFFGQIIFTGIFILLLILAHSYFSSTPPLRLNFYDLFLGMGLAALAALYPEGGIFVVLPLAVFIFLRLITRKTWLSFFLALLKIGLVAAIINPAAVGNAVRINLIAVKSVTAWIGWEYIRYASPFEMMGFHNIHVSRDFRLPVDLLMSLPVIFFWIFGFLAVKNRTFLTSLLIVAVLFFLQLRFITPNYYSYYKALTYTLFIFLSLFAIGLTYFLGKQLKFRFVSIVILVLVVALNLRAAKKLHDQLYWHHIAVDKSLISLAELNVNQKIQDPIITADVYIGEYNIWRRVWTEYFLMDKKLVTRQNYLIDEKLIQNPYFVLTEKKIVKEDNDSKDPKLVYYNIVWENDYYQLGEIVPVPYKK